MTRLPPLAGRLSRNERALIEARRRQEQWAHDQKRQGERDKRVTLQADIKARCAMPLRQALSESEHKAIFGRIRGAKL